MKKSLVLMAMAGVALASCVNDVADVAQNQEEKKALIRFDAPVTYTNGSRANFYGEIGAHQHGEGSSAETYTYPWRESFIVYAKKHAAAFTGWNNGTSNFWNNNTSEFILAKSDERFNGWSPATVVTTTDGEGKEIVSSPLTYEYLDHHWPNGYKLSFAAYSPAYLELGEGYNGISYGNTGLTIKNFKVQNSSAKHYDLMFSERTCDKTGYTSTVSGQGGFNYYNGIPIKFQHALSSIHFSLKNTSGKIVRLEGIKLYGVKHTGHFYENITEDGSSRYERKTSDRDGNVDPRWSFKKLGADGKELTEDMENITVIEDEGYIAFKGNIIFPILPEHVSSIFSKYVADKEGAGVTVDKNNEYAYALLLLPQELTDDAKIKVRYSVANSLTDVNPTIFEKEYQLNEYFCTPTTGASSKIEKWEIGTRYTYQLLYSDATVADDLIYFAPESTEWKDVTPIVITL